MPILEYDNGLLITSMRRVLQLYYLTEPETRVPLPSYIPESTVDPEAFERCTNLRLRFAMVQGMLNTVGATSGTPFDEAVKRLNLIKRAVLEEVRDFVSVVDQKRRDKEQALNERLKKDVPAGWKRKWARVHKLENKADEYLSVQLNAYDDEKLLSDREPPIYLWIQIDNEESYPVSVEVINIKASIGFTKATLEQPPELVLPYAIRHRMNMRRGTAAVANDLTTFFLMDFYINQFVMIDLVRDVLRPEGVQINELRAIMNRPMTQLVEFEQHWVTYRDWVRSQPDSHLQLDQNAFTEVNPGGFDITTIRYLSLMTEDLWRNNQLPHFQWFERMYTIPARKEGDLRGDFGTDNGWLHVDTPEQHMSRASTKALLWLAHEAVPPFAAV